MNIHTENIKLYCKPFREEFTGEKLELIEKQNKKNIFLLAYKERNFKKLERFVKDIININFLSEKINSYGQTLLHLAIEERSKIVGCLIKNGVNINSKDNFGYTPLYVALYSRRFKTVDYLLENGANPNIQTSYGHTALHHAVKCGFIDSVKNLLKYGADVNKETFIHLTPLYYAISELNYELIQLLLKNNANVNFQDFTKDSYLHNLLMKAEFKEFQKIFDLLIDYGINVEAKNVENLTALQYAIKHNVDRRIINILEKYSLENNKENLKIFKEEDKENFKIRQI